MMLTIKPCPLCGNATRWLTTDRLVGGTPFLERSLFVQCRKCERWRLLPIGDKAERSEPAEGQFAALVTYHDGSGVIGVYGPYSSEEMAADETARLRAAGVRPDDYWRITQLWSMAVN